MLSRSTAVVCELTTVSAVIRQQQLSSVHLIKIDVERAELAVLQGIDGHHWPVIKQVVAEVHELEGSRDAFLHLLKQAEFTSVSCTQDSALSGSTMYLVAASRS